MPLTPEEKAALKVRLEKEDEILAERDFTEDEILAEDEELTAGLTADTVASKYKQ